MIDALRHFDEQPRQQVSVSLHAIQFREHAVNHALQFDILALDFLARALPTDR